MQAQTILTMFTIEKNEKLKKKKKKNNNNTVTPLYSLSFCIFYNKNNRVGPWGNGTCFNISEPTERYIFLYNVV